MIRFYGYIYGRLLPEIMQTYTLAMFSSAIPCLLLCLFVLAPHLGSSYNTRYTHGGQHVVLRSSEHNSRIPLTCSPIPSGDDGLPVMHRLSPCSPLGTRLDGSKNSVDDTLYRDALRLQSLFGSSKEDSKTFGLTIPSTGNPLAALPGANEYHITVGFGSPPQKLAVGFDTATTGATFLQCKPCAAGAPCNKAFDPSRSSSLAQIPCGSRDCPFKACPGATCTTVTAATKKGKVLQNATFVTDSLTVGSLIPVFNFRVACLEMGARTTDSSSGVLDLSREKHSLASRVFLSPHTVAFSYCLPWDPYSPGFLSFDTTRPERVGRSVTYAKLHRNVVHPNLYFVKLVGISIVGDVLRVPRSTISGDALLEVHTTFTYLMPDLYAVLRDKFRGWMKGYPVAPSSGELDTCYDFSHLKSIMMPVITLRFEGGANLELDIEQVMYFKDNRNFFSVGCLAFAPLPLYAPGVAIIGSMAQAQTEVVYDILGGKVGFVPNRCF